MRRGLLFDCDGVLVDTRRANYFAYLSALETTLKTSFAKRFTYRHFTRAYGLAWHEWLPVIAGEAALEVHDLKTRVYGAQLRKHGRILCGLRAVEFWKERGIPVAVVSNASAHSIAELFDWIEKDFKLPYLREVPVFTPSAALAAKPHPSLIWEASRRLRLASSVLIDDDLRIGKQTAENANISFIHFSGNLTALNRQIETFLLCRGNEDFL
jgi:beta-phosphoglucomutase-like phosphatase (HAD superfamily)